MIFLLISFSNLGILACQSVLIPNCSQRYTVHLNTGILGTLDEFSGNYVWEEEQTQGYIFRGAGVVSRTGKTPFLCCGRHFCKY